MRKGRLDIRPDGPGGAFGAGLEHFALAHGGPLDDPLTGRRDGPARAVGDQLDDQPHDADDEQDQADRLDRDPGDRRRDREPEDEADGHEADRGADVNHAGVSFTVVSPAYPSVRAA